MPYFAATTHNHAVFADMFRNYSRKQQATFLKISVKYSLQSNSKWTTSQLSSAA